MTSEFHPMPDARLHARRLDQPQTGFVVAAMFTPEYGKHASRLVRSLDKVGLDYVLYEVPSVHRSISARGSDDIAFCKANFIGNMMAEVQRPLLYVDADVVFQQFPSKIAEIAAKRIDFAVYNWLADTANDAYIPVEVPIAGIMWTQRYYRYSHSIDLSDVNQLICSGAVQFYGGSEHARRLLSSWMAAVAQYPGVADDELLDYVFNGQSPAKRGEVVWLGKEYCRYPWWITVRPVIDHPDWPAAAESPAGDFTKTTGGQRMHVERATQHPPLGPFPRDCLIDVQGKCLLRVVGKTTKIVGRFEDELWLSR